MIRLGICIALAIGVLALAGCSGDTPTPPPPAGQPVMDSVATVCDHGNRVYRYITRQGGGGLAVVPADPTCKAGAQ